ncbi:conjugative transfer protein MobI(A/C) [Psychromonas sp. KJ10-2]|uniref:conjugative transfer protein MobI(A/C) n=1 Tax=Psychromonas sp. KJ10-2 TaxID=3391822 RepID=UPI0039B6B2CA
MKDIHSELQKNIYKAVDELYSDAVTYQEMWMRNIAKRELSLSSGDYQNGQELTISFPLIFQDSGFSMRWMKHRFIRNNNKLARLVKSISLPVSESTKKRSFKDASDWELSLILEVEEHLAPIRKELKHLMKMHLLLGYSVAASGGNFKAIKIWTE